MSAQPNFVLAVDGGNSKTIALVVQRDGTVVGAGRSGCGDIRRGEDMTMALEAVDSARKRALHQAGLSMFDIGACAFSMAGADWPEDAADFRKVVMAHGYPSAIVVNDGIGALHAGCPEGFGIAIASGTYAATGARSRDGTRQWHSGFWQKGLGATGIGGDAMDRVYKAEMGMIGPTVLTRKVLDHFGVSTVELMLRSFTSRATAPPGGVDQLARIVLDSADEGDQAALGILRHEAAQVAGTAIFAARQVGLDSSEQPFPLAVLGGVFHHPSPLLLEFIGEQFRRRFPQAWIRRSLARPIEGAAVIALSTARVYASERVRENIQASLPPPHFFAT